MAALSGGGRVASSWSNNYGLYFWNGMHLKMFPEIILR